MVEYKRKIKRKNLIYYLKVMEMVSGQLIGNMIDITTKGMLLICKKSIEVGTEVKYQIILPERIKGNDTIEVSAECVHCTVSKNRQFFDIGFRFTHLDQNFVPIIKILMEEYGFND